MIPRPDRSPGGLQLVRNTPEVRDDFAVARAKHIQLRVQIARSNDEIAKGLRLAQERELAASARIANNEDIERRMRASD